MSARVDFMRSSLRQLNSDYKGAIADLSADQLHWRANDHGCPIAFILWHYYRTQDNVIQFVLQRKPTVWLKEGWDKKFGLDRIAQGTGMSLEDAQGPTHRLQRGLPRLHGFRDQRHRRVLDRDG
jgi:hypothetical protein